jgi:hypothetical protein
MMTFGGYHQRVSACEGHVLRTPEEVECTHRDLGVSLAAEGFEKPVEDGVLYGFIDGDPAGSFECSENLFSGPNKTEVNHVSRIALS